jgi:cytochrome c peroxidase
MILRLFALCLCLGLFLGNLPGVVRASEIFTAAERTSILSLGPWPPVSNPDPGNRASGNPQAINLGNKLFFDRRLSKDGVLSCADCHQPDHDFADSVALNRGHGRITRHTPTVANLRWNNWFGWDGAADNLWAQSIRPILSSNEMAATPESIQALIRSDDDLRCRLRETFGTDAKTLDTRATLVLTGKALAAFQETLVTGPSAFDRYRDALANNNEEDAARYPAAARRGLKIFVGKGRCNFCHAGPGFSNNEFGNIGVSFFIEKGKVDPGRYGGIKELKSSPFNLLGNYNDDPSQANAVRTRHVVRQHRNWGEFKVPGLRNVARTPPYMHNGSIATLADVVEFYSSLDEERLHSDGERILRPLNLSESEKTDLLAFLQSLSAPVTEIQTPVACLP